MTIGLIFVDFYEITWDIMDYNFPYTSSLQ